MTDDRTTTAERLRALRQRRDAIARGGRRTNDRRGRNDRRDRERRSAQLVAFSSDLDEIDAAILRLECEYQGTTPAPRGWSSTAQELIEEARRHGR